MASYPAPDDRRSNTFNETDYLTTPAELASVGEENKYVKIGGDFMSGALSTPSLSTNELTLPSGVQTQPFTDVLKELLQTVGTKTQNISSPVLGTTEINGLTATNNLRLYNGTLTYADASVQTTAFTDTDRTNLDTCVSKTTSISYQPGWLKTTVAYTLHADYFTTGSFNSSHLSGTTSNVQQQLIDTNNRTQMITTEGGVLTLTFSDNTKQTTAFTSFIRSLLFTNQTQIATLQNKTDNITRQETITSITGSTYTPIMVIGTQINFPDGGIQTKAFSSTPTVTSLQFTGHTNGTQLAPYTEAERIRVNAPMIDSVRSNLTLYSKSIGLTSSGSSFISSTVSTFLLNLSTGLYTINGTLNVENINSVKEMKYRLKATDLPSSPYVGVNFESGFDNYGNFHCPISWTFSAVTSATVTIEIKCNYRPNSNMTSIFDYQVLNLL
jgi:hypothetical protein